ncbi:MULTISPECIES: VOC family protein [unclassified Streptomyces]|uniref:VOC family protein n=1 Tax=unclassified Streptomyces TaxID=2593676 RepID=UPI0025571399|nr:MULTISPECIES: VOC family protein [unclassified Streptomyces]WRZ69484.1 VOC family protein [Streptomyces sp. NBC_01257]WSU63418.1 VOC family protein [Streptomyces sp. NBC_01104]
MTINLVSLSVDAADLESESSFWHHLLGGSVTRTATHHFVQADGLPVLVIQHAPGHVPPQWPDGAAQQMHVDLSTDDAAAADQRVLGGGGRRLRPTTGVVEADRPGSRVYASPAGHPFCLRSA